MTVQISAYGRQVADLHSKTTSKGTPMAMASMAVPFRAARQMTERRNVAGLVIADSVISARTVRPGGKKGQQSDPYGDGIPFGDIV